ncbi:hypothetical protein LTR62_003596 [Meristemomyces frigidus]|uniref:Gfd2/YDR514C-like C-terminal domain-containing protein n=1 Tax=Meristemomyces frigidus TaxID=1508187 RepID=A0AAN7TIK7_9PEZI|nr:hypothetical protein LTR62_003596 [Meristemomyces frigidus]
MLGLPAPSKAPSTLTEPVFICIDCEAFEHAQHKITEIGLAVLDTRDLSGLTPAEDGANMISKVKYAHFKPIEYAHLKNRSFVKGCPDAFNFGPSTWIKLADTNRVLNNIFKDPCQLGTAADFSRSVIESNRNVVFVAHNAGSDVSYLKQLGFDISACKNVLATIDTQKLAGGSKRRSIGLNRLLLSLNLEPVNLHNAGNDAAYTMHAMLLMAVRDYSQPGIVPATLARFAGKLPPTRYNQVVAPHIKAGTTINDELGSTDVDKSAMPPMASTTRVKMGGTVRKFAVRATQSATRHNVASAMALQKPFPSSNSGDSSRSRDT